MFERTQLLRDDLDWLPPRYRAIRWSVAGTIWTGLVGGMVALVAASHMHVIFFGKGLAVLAAGGYVAGDKAARSVLRRQLKRLATGAVDPARLPAEPDGELVHVTGRVRVRPSGTSQAGTLTSVVSGQPVVWQRLVFTLDGTAHYVHETGVDFWLVGDTGDPIIVDTGHARMLVHDAKQVALGDEHPATARLEALPLVATTRVVEQRRNRRERGKKVAKLRVAETVLRDGDRVEVLGYKSRTIDPTMAERLERDTPYRATLRGGQALPLLVAPRPA